MKRLTNLLIVISIFAALSSCSKLENGSLDPGSLKSTAVYCNDGDFFSSYFLSPEGIAPNGWVLVRNDASFLNLYLKPASGFQDIIENVDIGFYSGSLPANSKPEVDDLHYHFTTGAIDPSLGFQLDFPINDIFIENLQAAITLNCGEPIYMIIHYDALDGSGNSIDVWTGNIQVDGISEENFWFYKYFSYTPACCVTCTSETAWAAGDRYISRGNWATYTHYDGELLTVDLFAGQTKDAGDVTFSTPNDGMITITIDLADGWFLQAVDEPVKIQGYDTAPSGNPPAGSFNTYKGELLQVTVPAYNFYGVHLDLQNCY